MKPKNTTKLFGTDGIRGEAGKFPLDPPTVRIVGASLARHLAERNRSVPQIVVGRDTRESGASIAAELMVAARAAGSEVQSAGIITTPGVAFLARTLPANAGVVISASHNAYQDNGIKIFDPSGRKLDETTERQIEKDIAAEYDGTPSLDSDAIYQLADQTTVHEERESEALQRRYLDYLAHEIANGLALNGLKIVVDCANGAAYQLAPTLFRRLGAEIVAINVAPNGQNINRECGSLHLEGLRRTVTEERADLGVAFDGDADRALFVEANGALADGDATLWVLANYLKSRGELAGNKVVATVMSNLGLELALRSRGIDLVRTDVGDKYVLEELLRSGATIGGEQSGHIIFPDLSLAGDGMITTLCLLRVIRDQNCSLADLTHGFQRYPQILVNVRVRDKTPFERLPAVQRLARRLKENLGERGRLLLRYSGTEPLARIMIEGESESEIKTAANQLAQAIRQELGANHP